MCKATWHCHDHPAYIWYVFFKKLFHFSNLFLVYISKVLCVMDWVGLGVVLGSLKFLLWTMIYHSYNYQTRGGHARNIDRCSHLLSGLPMRPLPWLFFFKDGNEIEVQALTHWASSSDSTTLCFSATFSYLLWVFNSKMEIILKNILQNSYEVQKKMYKKCLYSTW